jgi:hypothetical protein
MAEHSLEFKISQWVEIGRKDLNLKVYSDGSLLGTLKISQGSIDWSPGGFKKEKPHVISWEEFDKFARSQKRSVKKLSGKTK